MTGSLRWMFFCLFLLGVCGAGVAPAWSMSATVSPDSAPLAAGAPFPNLTLKGANQPEALARLGLDPAKQEFTLSAAKPEALIVLVFSMYCPYCQREAPILNDIQLKLQARGLAARIGLVGVGAGNSEIEVDVFRKKFNISFPLFSDSDFTAHKALGNVGTPFHYLLTKGPDGWRVVDGMLGCIESADGFIDDILARLGEKKK